MVEFEPQVAIQFQQGSILSNIRVVTASEIWLSQCALSMVVFSKVAGNQQPVTLLQLSASSGYSFHLKAFLSCCSFIY